MGKQTSATTTAQKEQTWRDHFARQISSGKTIAAFCRSEGLSEGGFYAWRNRLRANGGNETLTQRPPATPFVDLGAVNSATSNAQKRHAASQPNAATSEIQVRIELGGGIVLTIARH